MLLGAATFVTLGVLALHSAQVGRQQELQREAPGVADRAATAAAMKTIGYAAEQHILSEDAEKDKKYRDTAAGKQMKALEDADRRWLAEHPISPASVPSAAR